MDLLEDKPISIRAHLHRLRKEDDTEDTKYSLNFDLEKKFSRIFLLKETKSGNSLLRTPRALHTSSDEVFEVAQNWIKQCTDKCNCAQHWDDPKEKWYPKRLLDLDELRKANGLEEIDGLTILSRYGDPKRIKIRLVELNERNDIGARTGERGVSPDSTETISTQLPQRENYRYVTLSHCWGKPSSVLNQLKLTSKTEERFKKQGIELRELPKTFRDAILFACRLEKVGYIWIDSLCIKQRITDSALEKQGGAQDDWLEQSRVMDKIYLKSYLNISATAATDSNQGLFFDRRPEYLWEDEINVNYTGLNLVGSTRTGSTKEDELTRCTLIDVSFWDDLVAHAPVNDRAWVLQERLMAPRVLHFCRDQVAWECKGFQDAEGHPERDMTLKARLGSVVDEGRLKDLTPEAGLALRKMRLKGFADPDEGMKDLHVYELWKHIVEVYSRTRLTVSRDKLIALSGIAKFFRKTQFDKNTKNEYVAGMWSRCLESQLLWQVNELYRDGIWENPARRDPNRAPSFSWASIDTPHGITYADVTDYGQGDDFPAEPHDHGNDDRSTDQTGPLLFKIEHYQTKKSDPKNEFGMVDEGLLLLKPEHLRPIKLSRVEPPLRVPYSWRLSETKLEKPVEHSNLYLDAPDSDVDIFNEDAKLFCMPAAYGPRTDHETLRYLYCLLLKYEKDLTEDSGTIRDYREGDIRRIQQFRRIGITKLSEHADHNLRKDLESGSARDAAAGELICLM